MEGQRAGIGCIIKFYHNEQQGMLGNSRACLSNTSVMEKGSQAIYSQGPHLSRKEV